MTSNSYENSVYDPAVLTEAVTNIASQCHEIMTSFISHEQKDGAMLLDPIGLGQAYLDLTMSMMKNPEKLVEAQVAAWNSYLNLWLGTANKFMGKESKSIIQADKGDRRFRHEAWENNPFFDFIKQSYLVAANTIQSIVAQSEDLDEKTAHKLQFYTKQFVDALSPTNFIATNPEVLQATIDSHGENLLRGLQNFVDDFDAENGRLRIKMTDTDAFELGKNVAVSPGKVIYQNEMMQLLQFSPATEKVYKQPLLIIPPWINKYYILDLQPKNSFIKWLVEQGHTVFVISWINPDEKLADKDFQDYVFEGPLAALEAIEQATGEQQVNAIGYCIGGTLLAATLAYMEARNDRRITSATFLTALLDFSMPGDLGVFIDEQQLQNLEKTMNERGYHAGSEMSSSFNMLRSNDLIWSFFINNYLLGKEPFPFDLLYWNSDTTRMPAKMHSTYLRSMYLENRFKDPAGMKIGDVDIDLSSITVPSYFLSTEDDHISPWEGTYLGAQLLHGPTRFVLGKSGHIAGVVNHPDANKYGYYTGPAPELEAGEWRAQTESKEGSWWPDWNEWVNTFNDEMTSARVPGKGKLKALEDAPGSYVKLRLDNI